MFLKNSDTDHFTDLIQAFWAINPFSDLYTFGCVEWIISAIWLLQKVTPSSMPHLFQYIFCKIAIAELSWSQSCLFLPSL